MTSKKPRSLKEALKDVLTEEEMKNLVTSFDIIGDIVVIEIPRELEHKEEIVGEAILQVHKNVKTVCKREDIHKGTFRIRPVKVIAGEKKTETMYKEHGVTMKLDVSKVYFSPRLSHERERIANLVKPGEVIAAFFAGVGPFPLVIARKQPDVKTYAIELNPTAFEYMVENIRINKMQMIIDPIFGDVKEEAPKLPELNRIVMPLPKGGEAFLDTAFECAARNCVIHFYHFGDVKEPFSEAEKIVMKEAKKKEVEIEIINRREVRPYSPSLVQVVLDILVK